MRQPDGSATHWSEESVRLFTIIGFSNGRLRPIWKRLLLSRKLASESITVAEMKGRMIVDLGRDHSIAGSSGIMEERAPVAGASVFQYPLASRRSEPAVTASDEISSALTVIASERR